MNLWAAVEERERKKKDNDKSHIRILAGQRDDDRQRKLEAKRINVEEALYKNKTAPALNLNQPSNSSPKQHAITEDDGDVYKADENAIQALKTKLALYEKEYQPKNELPSQIGLQYVPFSNNINTKLQLPQTENAGLLLDFVQSKLQVNEQQLEHERKARQSLEAQFQLGQTQLYNAISQLDSIKSTQSQEQSLKNSLLEKLAAVEQRLQAQAQAGEALVKQAMAVVSTRTMQLERNQSSQETQALQLDQELKMAKQALVSATRELQQLKTDLSSRLSVVESSQQQQQSIVRSLQTQETGINTLKVTSEQTDRDLEQKIGILGQELRRFAEDQQAFRPTIDERFHETLRRVNTERNESERNWASRFESIRSQVESLNDQQRLELTAFREQYQHQLQGLQTAVSNKEADMEERLMKQIMNALSATEAENQARVKFQQYVEKEIQQIAMGIIQNFQRQLDEYRSAQRQQDTFVKTKFETLEQGVVQLSKDHEQKLQDLNKRFTADITKQQEVHQKAAFEIESMQENMAKLQGQWQDEFKNGELKQTQQLERLKQDVKGMAEQLVQLQAKHIKDIDTQVASLQRRVAEEATQNSKWRQSFTQTYQKDQASGSYNVETLQKQVTDTSSELFKRLKVSDTGVDEFRKAVQSQIETLQNQFKLKNTQFDQTLAIFKDEFKTKVNVSEWQAGEQRAIQRIDMTTDYVNSRLASLESLANWINEHEFEDESLKAAVKNFSGLQKANEDFRRQMESEIGQLSLRFQACQREYESTQTRLQEFEKSSSETDALFSTNIELLSQKLGAEMDDISRSVRDKVTASQLESFTAATRSDVYRVSTQLETFQWINKDLSQRVLHLEERLVSIGNKPVKLATTSNLPVMTKNSNTDTTAIERELKSIKTNISRQEHTIESLIKQRQATTEKQVAILEKDVAKMRMANSKHGQYWSSESGIERNINSSVQNIHGDSAIDSPILAPMKNFPRSGSKGQFYGSQRYQSAILRPSESQVSELNLDTGGLLKTLSSKYSGTFRKNNGSSSDSLELRSGVQSSLIPSADKALITSDFLSPSRLFANTSLASVHKKSFVPSQRHHRRRASSIPKFLSSPNSASNSTGNILSEASDQFHRKGSKSMNHSIVHSFSDTFNKDSSSIIGTPANISEINEKEQVAADSREQILSSDEFARDGSYPHLQNPSSENALRNEILNKISESKSSLIEALPKSRNSLGKSNPSNAVSLNSLRVVDPIKSPDQVRSSGYLSKPAEEPESSKEEYQTKSDFRNSQHVSKSQKSLKEQRQSQNSLTELKQSRHSLESQTNFTDSVEESEKNGQDSDFERFADTFLQASKTNLEEPQAL